MVCEEPVQLRPALEADHLSSGGLWKPFETSLTRQSYGHAARPQQEPNLSNTLILSRRQEMQKRDTYVLTNSEFIA